MSDNALQQDEPINAAAVAQTAFDVAVTAALAAGLDPLVALQRALNRNNAAQA
jgi:hypothetical protein